MNYAIFLLIKGLTFPQPKSHTSSSPFLQKSDFTCVCVCVCVCARARARVHACVRARDRERQRQAETETDRQRQRLEEEGEEKEEDRYCCQFNKVNRQSAHKTGNLYTISTLMLTYWCLQVVFLHVDDAVGPARRTWRHSKFHRYWSPTQDAQSQQAN